MQVGPMQLVLILVIVLILFGAGRLPQVFEQFGKGIKAFRDAQREDPRDVTNSDVTNRDRRELADKDDIDDAHEVRRTRDRDHEHDLSRKSG
jgi:sec-independent protein translocase protein TatA